MKKLLTPLSLIIVIALGIVDHFTGYEISFSIFYIFPILVTAWFRGRPSGIIIAFLSALTWLAADLTSGHSYSHNLIPLWNMSMRFCVFTIMVFLLSAVKKNLDLQNTLLRLDVLTGLDNVKSFMERANIEKSRSARFKRPFTIAYIDIDNFKQLNDTFGHVKGDILLREVGKAIRENIRTYDITGRFGGDEFVLLFPETDNEQARPVVNKIKSCVEEVLKKHFEPLTLSIGVLTVSKPDYPMDGMIKISDDLMYSVKKKNKNGIAYDVID